MHLYSGTVVRGSDAPAPAFMEVTCTDTQCAVGTGLPEVPEELWVPLGGGDFFYEEPPVDHGCEGGYTFGQRWEGTLTPETLRFTQSAFNEERTCNGVTTPASSYDQVYDLTRQ